MRVITINIHKGYSSFLRRSTLARIRHKLRLEHADLVFIQELQDLFPSGASRKLEPVNPSAIEFLADAYWLDWHYGKNAVYPKGHHGNAILSRYPLNKGLNYDLSAYRFERRGALHSVFEKKRLNGGMQSIHCFSIHLTLFEHGRKRQITQLIDEISYLAHSAPVIIAGDFNDWRNSLGPLMASYGFQEVFETLCGKPARTYPAFQPLLRMDRIYVRGLSARSARTLNHWANLSDHIGLLAELDLR